MFFSILLQAPAQGNPYLALFFLFAICSLLFLLLFIYPIKKRYGKITIKILKIEMQRIPVYVIIPLLGIFGWGVFGVTGAVVALLFIFLIVIDKRNKPKNSINKVEQLKELKNN